jgi:GTPase SAR1 family protein
MAASQSPTAVLSFGRVFSAIPHIPPAISGRIMRRSGGILQPANSMCVSKKIVVVGSSCVGKSNLISVYTKQHYVEDYTPTIQESVKASCDLEDSDVIVDIIDTGGNATSMIRTLRRT